MKHIFYYIPSLLVAILIAYLSLLRETNLTLPTFSGWDKIAHLLMYLALAGTMLWDSRRANQKNKYTHLIIGTICAIYGGLLEVLQECFFYPRTGDWFDWFADCAGTVIGIGLASKIWIIRKNNTIF